MDKLDLTPIDLQACLNLSPQLLCTLRQDGYFQQLHPTWERCLGWTRAELSAQPWTARVHPDDRAKTEAAIAGDRAAPVTFKHRYRHRDGCYRWLSWRVSPFRAGVAHAVAIEITERQLTEERLRLLESVVVNANDAVVITEAEPIEFPGPRIVYVNAAFTRCTGYTAAEVMGKTPRILQGEKTDRTQLQTIHAALQQQKPVKVELINYRKDGREFWVEIEIVPLLDLGGAVTHFVSVQRDISDRKQIEEENRRALAREKELNELKSRFISMVSHEFRTPLSTILCSTELLENYGQQWSEEKKQVRFVRIKDAVKRMSHLLNDVLTIGKVDAGRLQFCPAALDITEFCQQLIEEFQHGISTAHTLNLQVPAEPIVGHLDAQLLRYILTNLISNAVKYSPAEGAVQLQVMADDRAVSFSVCDRGIGIPPSDQEILFQIFQRGSNVGTISGTGLGLAIVKHCVELHSGHIALKSTIERGTVFTVTLPLDGGAGAACR